MNGELWDLFAVTALLAGVAFLMVVSGVQKGMLEWKRRTCPSCGSLRCTCRTRDRRC